MESCFAVIGCFHLLHSPYNNFDSGNLQNNISENQKQNGVGDGHQMERVLGIAGSIEFEIWQVQHLQQESKSREWATKTILQICGWLNLGLKSSFGTLEKAWTTVASLKQIKQPQKPTDPFWWLHVGFQFYLQLWQSNRSCWHLDGYKLYNHMDIYIYIDL